MSINPSSPKDLLIPLYLDTNTLIDLLAAIDSGYSVSDHVTTASLESNDAQASAGMGFGFGAVMSFFSLRDRTIEESNQWTETERMHTIGSLLHRLRSLLIELNCLTIVDSQKVWDSLSNADIVELQGRFQPNSIFASLARLQDIFEFTNKLHQSPSRSDKSPSSARRSSKQTTPTNDHASASGQDESFRMARHFLDFISTDLSDDQSLLYVVELTDVPDHRAVVSLFPSLLRAKSGIELPEGDFRLLGKVSRVLRDDESVDLLRGTKLSGLGSDMIERIIAPLEMIPTSALIPPPIVTHIPAPAITVIPIAVYV